MLSNLEGARRSPPIHQNLVRIIDDNSLATVLNGTQWLAASLIDSHLGLDIWHGESKVKTWLRNGQLFALELDGRRVLPGYQFDAVWSPYPVIKALLSVFSTYSSIWIASWMASANNELNGKSPSEVLASDPQALIYAASRHEEGAAHG